MKDVLCVTFPSIIIIIVIMQCVHCPEKKRSKCFFVMSSIKLGQLWWNLVHSFLHKVAAKPCKRFPPHLNNVSTLPCETWNDHRTGATIALSEKETPEFIPPQLWPPQICQVWTHSITKCGYYCKRCTKYASLIWTNWNSDWKWHGPSWIMSSLR